MESFRSAVAMDRAHLTEYGGLLYVWPRSWQFGLAGAQAIGSSHRNHAAFIFSGDRDAEGRQGMDGLAECRGRSRTEVAVDLALEDVQARADAELVLPRWIGSCVRSTRSWTSTGARRSSDRA